MLRTTFHAVLVMSAVICCFDANSAFAQKSANPVRLEGFSGSVSVQPNADRKEVTVALTLAAPRDGKSNQIVFHIQEEDEALAGNWVGAAHLLVGDGAMAVVPDDGSRGMLFRFSEVERPASLDGLQLSEYQVFGIARFGESKPLSSEEIDTLVRTGRVSSGSEDFNPKALRVRPDVASQQPDYYVYCPAGGPGSSSCSTSGTGGASGCSVSCRTGYYSCCSGGVCWCLPNPK